MQKVSLISVLAILALVGVFNTPTVAAQSKACSLVLDVSTLDENGQAKPVKNVRAFVVRRSTRRRIPATVVSGSPQFPRLRVGHYRLTILKRGFENITQEVDFSCSAPNSNIAVEVSLEPTGGFSESALRGLDVRKELITDPGTTEPGQSDGAARNEPAGPRPAKSIS
ncbi:MAG TPA: hypothetical protein VGO68_13740, partial [Pyrinomonadaceae bacterium]|nr:hypothetical protein [Pyrinomonadaceae bacterium]